MMKPQGKYPSYPKQTQGENAMRAIICSGTRFSSFQSSLSERRVVELMEQYDIVVNEFNFIDMQERNYSARWDFHIASNETRSQTAMTLHKVGVGNSLYIVEDNKGATHVKLVRSPRLIINSYNYSNRGFETDFVAKIIEALKSMDSSLIIELDMQPQR